MPKGKSASKSRRKLRAHCNNTIQLTRVIGALLIIFLVLAVLFIPAVSAMMLFPLKAINQKSERKRQPSLSFSNPDADQDFSQIKPLNDSCTNANAQSLTIHDQHYTASPMASTSLSAYEEVNEIVNQAQQGGQIATSQIANTNTRALGVLQQSLDFAVRYKDTQKFSALLNITARLFDQESAIHFLDSLLKQQQPDFFLQSAAIIAEHPHLANALRIPKIARMIDLLNDANRIYDQEDYSALAKKIKTDMQLRTPEAAAELLKSFAKNSKWKLFHAAETELKTYKSLQHLFNNPEIQKLIQEKQKHLVQNDTSITTVIAGAGIAASTTALAARCCKNKSETNSKKSPSASSQEKEQYQKSPIKKSNKRKNRSTNATTTDILVSPTQNDQKYTPPNDDNDGATHSQANLKLTSPKQRLKLVSYNGKLRPADADDKDYCIAQMLSLQGANASTTAEKRPQNSKPKVVDVTSQSSSSTSNPSSSTQGVTFFSHAPNSYLIKEMEGKPLYRCITISDAYLPKKASVSAAKTVSTSTGASTATMPTNSTSAVMRKKRSSLRTLENALIIDMENTFKREQGQGIIVTYYAALKQIMDLLQVVRIADTPQYNKVNGKDLFEMFSHLNFNITIRHLRHIATKCITVNEHQIHNLNILSIQQSDFYHELKSKYANAAYRIKRNSEEVAQETCFLLIFIDEMVINFNGEFVTRNGKTLKESSNEKTSLEMALFNLGEISKQILKNYEILTKISLCFKGKLLDTDTEPEFRRRLHLLLDILRISFRNRVKHGCDIQNSASEATGKKKETGKEDVQPASPTITFEQFYNLIIRVKNVLAPSFELAPVEPPRRGVY